jgi:hypothetical protein
MEQLRSAVDSLIERNNQIEEKFFLMSSAILNADYGIIICNPDWSVNHCSLFAEEVIEGLKEKGFYQTLLNDDDLFLSKNGLPIKEKHFESFLSNFLFGGRLNRRSSGDSYDITVNPVMSGEKIISIFIYFGRPER